MVVRKIKNVFVNSIDYSYLRYGYIKKKKREQYLLVLENQVSPASLWRQAMSVILIARESSSFLR